jgi:hypothetical protein
MALLGKYGTVSFLREWAEPTVIDESRVIGGGRLNSLDVSEPAIWSGDRVLILCERGVPLIPLGESYAPSPGGHSFYGDGRYDPGPIGKRRQALDLVYTGGRNSPFYDPLPLVQSFYAFVHRNEIDNMTFYAEEDHALNGEGDSLLPISILDSGPIVISPAPEGNYSQSLINRLLSFAAPSILAGRDSELTGEQFLPPGLLKELADYLELVSQESGWRQVANLTSWVFETNVDLLDQNAIGQRFGESAKGSLKGAGSLNAIIGSDRSGLFGPSSMLRLMLVTQVGAKAMAKFTIADSRNSEEECTSTNKAVHYEAPIILSNTNINTTVDEVITLGVQFVATGKIRIVSSAPR